MKEKYTTNKKNLYNVLLQRKLPGEFSSGHLLSFLKYYSKLISFYKCKIALNTKMGSPNKNYTNQIVNTTTKLN